MVVLAGLGLTHSQQSQEQTQLDEELVINEMRLNKFNFTELQQRRDELQKQIDDYLQQNAEAINMLQQTVESIDVTDEFFVVAAQCGVKVMNISTSAISTSSVNNVGCLAININASVEGEVPNIVYFIISLNADYTTGYVRSAQINIPKACSAEIPKANIQMTIYAYEGE